MTRVTDQDPEFLRFVERRDLKPGEVVEVEERDAAADSVRLRGARRPRRHDRRARRVEGARAGGLGHHRCSCCCWRWRGSRRTTPRAGGRKPAAVVPFEIHGQFVPGRGGLQPGGLASSRTFSGSSRQGGVWQLAFTQEWPVPARASPASPTRCRRRRSHPRDVRRRVPELPLPGAEEGPGRPAFSPRASLIIPTGRRRRTAPARRACRSTCRSASSAATSTSTGTAASPGCRGATGPT